MYTLVVQSLGVLHTRSGGLQSRTEKEGSLEDNRKLASQRKEIMMNHLQLTQIPVAKAEMLIRRPVADIFEAFVNPNITSQFWFTKSSGRLEQGHQIRWEWEMYHASTQVDVLAIEENKRILIEWDGYSTRTRVEWIFTPNAEQTTFVSITESGFVGDGDELVQQAVTSTGGFAFVLSGLKAFLEHSIILNLVADHHPKELETPS
jgi:uncharacterized protein YndB with AHSA1/START domain